MSQGRQLTFNIFRYDPQEPNDKPKWCDISLTGNIRHDGLYRPQ